MTTQYESNRPDQSTAASNGAGVDSPAKPPVVDPRVHEQPLISPFVTAGLVDVFRRRYLLRLLVQKEVSSRYQGSLLGLLWSYVQPLVRFAMYFFVIGLVLGMHKNVPNFAIHLFSALVAVHFFTETFSNGTRSIVKNKALVRKMAMPREMFPVSSCIVSAVNSFPQLLILFVACLAVGWHPDAQAFLAGFLGIAICTVLGIALALLFSAMNVFFRDFQNIVQTFQLFTHWIVPMMYPFSKLAESSMHGTWFYTLYMSNPLTAAVLLVQRCFWVPTSLGEGKGAEHVPADQAQVGFPIMPDHLIALGFLMLTVSLVILVFCQIAFRRLEGKFAERL
jgi:ABC-2 type transport system permease protein